MQQRRPLAPRLPSLGLGARGQLVLLNPLRLEFPILSLNPRLRPRGVAPDV